MYYVYIVRCSDDSLYTGTASDICRRMRQHVNREKNCAKYTRSHQVVELSALWQTSDKPSALRLEHAIKRLERKDKLRLISSPQNIRVLITFLQDAEYISIQNITLDECVSYSEKKMNDDEKADFLKKLGV